MGDRLAVIQSEESVKELKRIEDSMDELLVKFNVFLEASEKVNKGFKSGTIKGYLDSMKLMPDLQEKANAAHRVADKELSLLDKARRKHAFSLTNEGKELIKIRTATNQVNKENRDSAKAALEFASAYDDLNRRHTVAVQKAKDSGVQHGVLSREFLKAASEANALDQKLKVVDRSLGKFNRHVGEYERSGGKMSKGAGGIMGLNMQMQQVMREMPNFAMSANIGIMSLSNNLPYLAESISNVNKQAKIQKKEFKASAISAKEMAYSTALASGASEELAIAKGKEAEAMVMANYQAKKAPSLFKQLSKSVFNWQTLLVVGISLMVAYSDEIGEWTSKLFKSKKAITSQKDAIKELNKIKEEGVKNASEEIVKSEILYKTMTNETLSREARLKAAKKLQELYPKYFGNMSTENMMLGKAIGKYKELKTAILDSARAKAIQRKIEEKWEDYIEEEEAQAKHLARSKRELEAIERNPNSTGTKSSRLSKDPRAVSTEVVSHKDYVIKAKRNVQEQERKLKNIKEEGRKKLEFLSNELMKISNQKRVLDLVDDGKKKPTPTPKPSSSISKEKRTALDLLIASKNNEIAIIKEARLKQEITEEEYGKKYIKIHQNYSEKVTALLQESNAKGRKISASARKKAIEEIEKTYKYLYDVKKRESDKLYKIDEQRLKNEENQAKNNGFLTEVEKIKAQSDAYNKRIELTANHYDNLIELAKEYSQNTLKIEGERDAKILSLSQQRDSVNLQLGSAFKKDISNQNNLLKAIQELKFEEQKRLILTNDRISQEQREYLIYVLEKEEQKKINEIEMERLNTIKNTLLVKQKMNFLTIDEKNELADISEKIEGLKNKNIEIDIDIQSKIDPKLKGIISVLQDGFRNLGLDNIADEVDSFFTKMKNKTLKWEDFAKMSASAVADFSSQLIEAEKNQRIEALDQELEASREKTDQEISFIDKRLEYFSNMQDLTAEQIEERNALEDEARVLREQQGEREKMIQGQKARAEQKASAQQAIIGGLVGGAKALPNFAAAAISVALGALYAGLIMSKDPVPKYYVGRDGGKAEWAWTQEKGREIITDRFGNIKDMGSDGGAKMTWLDEGDKVFTAEKTDSLLNLPSLDLSSLVMKPINPNLIIQNKNVDNSDKIIKGFEKVMKKYDKVHYFTDEEGNIYSQNGGQYPIFRGKEKKQKSIIIKTEDNGRN